MAYEIAPFNIKLTVLQASIEIGILTNLVTSVPPITPAYSPAVNPAPLFRGILNRLISSLLNANSKDKTDDNQDSDNESGDDHTDSPETGPFSVPEVVSMHLPLSSTHLQVLVGETVHAITSIGGHENPPARHIIGHEGAASVKEKLKTVSRELEDFVQTSSAVDITVDENANQASS